MQIERISYQKTFNLGSYQSQRIGVDIILNPEDSADEAFAQARELVEKYHSETAPVMIADNPPEQVQQISNGKLTPEQNLIQQIESCQELKVLESYRLIAKTKPEYQTAYDNTLNKLKA